MRNSDSEHPLSDSPEGMQPVVLVQQLMQQIVRMQHVDEVLQWLSQALVGHLHIPLVQIWITQEYENKSSRTELRAIANPNTLGPQQIHINRQIASLIERLLTERHGCPVRSVLQLFPPAQAQLLVQAGLHYWSGEFLELGVLLPPSNGAPPAGQKATPLKMVIALFTSQTLSSGQERASNFLAKQALRIATTRGLLLPLSQTPSVHPPGSAPKQAPQLVDLLPRRTPKMEELQGLDPFTSAAIIPDKKVRRLYSLINGQRAVAQLALQADLDQKKMVEALRMLLEQHLIQFYTASGEAIEASSLLISSS